MKRIKSGCNTAQALESALRGGGWDGLGLDVRANDLGIPVVERRPGYGEPLSLMGYLSCVATVAQQLHTKPFLAVDVRSAGMAPAMQALLRGREDYFLYNVPGDELKLYDHLGLRVFSRWSEDDQQRPVTGTVVDCVEGDYTPFELMVNDPLLAAKAIAVLCPTLRDRGKAPLTGAQLERLRCEYLITSSTE